MVIRYNNFALYIVTLHVQHVLKQCNAMQDMLPALYRGHDALLFTSRYEAWGMPVLEGMASGLPIVATSCLGVQTFAQHGVNALLADPQVTLTLCCPAERPQRRCRSCSSVLHVFCPALRAKKQCREAQYSPY